jgi:1-pyrroline-5-carboxylate dehydrogenase
MSNAFYQVPKAVNEPLLGYKPNSPEKIALKVALKEAKSKQIDVPMYIGGKHVTTDDKVAMTPPHEHQHVLGYYNRGQKAHFEAAIEAALKAKPQWEAMPWQDRAAIFLKAADLLSGPYRAKMMAATMLGQSKNAYQAEIDCIAEYADFLRFNVQFMTEIYAQQPISSPGLWNRLEYRPLEGFIFALTPFNFTAIAGNLGAAPAMLGNVIVWKPADTQIYSAHVIMEIFEEAGLPAGVINMIYGDGPTIGDTILSHRDFAGLHFTGSTGVFQHLWKAIGNNISNYKSYPRIVGETGGKDFIVAHPSADPKAVAVAMGRGAFEYQGQKCSAASRAYIPKSLWKKVEKHLVDDIKSMKMGSTEDFTNFVNAVIDERAFDKIAGYIKFVKESTDAKIIVGGGCDKSKGYFIEPTVVVTEAPQYRTLCEEIFGPVLTVFVYADKDYEKTLELVDNTSPYALTGAVFSQDRYALNVAFEKLRNAAGNFYINDKPTGAVVGQQPFGGARASGTNDKAGSILNLYRWVSPRTIKETLVPPVDYRYPFMLEE